MFLAPALSTVEDVTSVVQSKQHNPLQEFEAEGLDGHLRPTRDRTVRTAKPCDAYLVRFMDRHKKATFLFLLGRMPTPHVSSQMIEDGSEHFNS